MITPDTTAIQQIRKSHPKTINVSLVSHPLWHNQHRKHLRNKRGLHSQKVMGLMQRMAIVQEKKAAAESNARYHKENAKVDKVVDLMEKWGRACEAMGSRIKAAHMLALNSNNFWREKKRKDLRGTERSRMHHC
jgi:hypothetical protein